MEKGETPISEERQLQSEENDESVDDDLASSYINELSISGQKARKFTKVQENSTRINHVWTEDEMKKIVILRFGSLDTSLTPKYTFRELALITKKSVTWCQTIVSKYIARQFVKTGIIDAQSKTNAQIQWVQDKKEQAEKKIDIVNLRGTRKSGKWPGSTISPQNPCAPYDETSQQATPEFLKKILTRIQDPDQRAAQISSQIQEKLQNLTENIPNNFICPLTKSLMKDPVFITSGFTYDKEALNQHFQTKGYVDPLSNQPVDPKFMIPNQQLREQIQQYVADNPTLDAQLRQDSILELRKQVEDIYRKPMLSELWMIHPGAQMQKSRKKFIMRQEQLEVVLNERILKRLKHKEIQILLKAPNDVLSWAITTLNEAKCD